MEQQVIETVMRELLEEEKISNIKLDEMNKQLGVTETQIKNFKDYVAQVKLNVPPIDTLKMELMLMEYLSKSQKEIEQIKAVVAGDRKKQRLKDLVVDRIGWILAITLLVILLGLAIK